MNSEARSKDLYKNNKGIGSVSFTMEDIKCFCVVPHNRVFVTMK